MNWRGKPLVSHEVIVKLIAATTTRTGLRVRSGLDQNAHPEGVSVSDADMATLYLRQDAFHGEWNYSLLPRERLLWDSGLIRGKAVSIGAEARSFMALWRMPDGDLDVDFVDEEIATWATQKQARSTSGR